MGSAFRFGWIAFALSLTAGTVAFVASSGGLSMLHVFVREASPRPSLTYYLFYPAIIGAVMTLATAATRGRPMRDTTFRNVVLVGTTSILFIAQLRSDTNLIHLQAMPQNYFQFTGFLAGLLLIAAGNYLPKAVRQDALDLSKPWNWLFSIPWTLPFGYLFGVRTWWTLASEHVWNRTHHLTARLWMISGVGLAAAAWITDIEGYRPMILASLVVNIAIPVLYSFLIRQTREIT